MANPNNQRAPEDPDWRDARLHAGVNTGNEDADRALFARMAGAVIKRGWPPIMRAEKYASMSAGDKLKRLAGYVSAASFIAGVLRGLFWGPLKHLIQTWLGGLQ